jgi:hypothetical protein
MINQTMKSTMTSEINATWSHVKLSSQRREKLRTAVRRHPSITQHLHSRTAVGQLRKAALLSLAADLGIDYAAVLSSPAEQQPKMGAEAQTGALSPDPFSGEIAFDLAMEFLGKTVTRKARIRYTHTPAWAYFDRESGKDVVPFGKGGSYSLELQSLAESEITYTDREAVERGRTFRKRLATTWEPCNDLTEVGIWSEEMWDAIRDQIDRDCRARDAANRRLPRRDVPIPGASAA